MLCYVITHFPKLSETLQKRIDHGLDEYNGTARAEMLCTLAERFESRFRSFDELKPFVTLLSNPFDFDVAKGATVCDRLGLDKRQFEEESMEVRAMDENRIDQLKGADVREVWANFTGPALRLGSAKL